MHESPISANIEEYLEWIYRLSKEEVQVTTTDLARRLKVSPASVTGMLKRLAERNLIHYEPYHEISLTDQGRQVAMSIVRRHGLLERLLTDVLGLPWHLADEEASRLEHAITPDVEERLARFLGNPETCPHGQPLDWETKTYSAVRLSGVIGGNQVRVSRIGDESPEFLSYIQTLGLMPGVTVDVRGRAPFNGPLMVEVAGQEHALGNEVASSVWVEPIRGGQDDTPADEPEKSAA